MYLGAPVATPLDPRQRLITTKYNPARTWTPENAVGIGGAYMCIYGMEGPGGYQFVGRTLQVYNRFRKTRVFQEGKPWLLRFFDQIRFHPVYNGYNQATDLNGRKTISLQGSFALGTFFANLMYMGGDERPKNDGSGAPWRNMVDFVTQWDAHPRFSLALHANTGWEKGNVGNHAWGAGAFYARLKAADWLYFAGRADGIYERVPHKDPANSILILGADHIFSTTFTAEFRPVGDGFSLRIEYRHDDSDRHQPQYFRRGLNPDGTQRASATGNTLTVGMTGWFWRQGQPRYRPFSPRRLKYWHHATQVAEQERRTR